MSDSKPVEMRPRPYGEKELRDAQRRTARAARERERLGLTGRLTGSGRLRMQVDPAAVFNAVNQEGPEVLSRAGEESYWRDMRRRHPEIAVGQPDSGQSLNGMRNRHGRVSMKILFRNGKKVVMAAA